MMTTPVIPLLDKVLRYACISGYWRRCEELLENHLRKTTQAYRQFKKVKGTYNPLHEVLVRGYVELLAVFVKNHFPLSYVVDVPQRATMLNVASSHGQVNVMKFLLFLDANPNDRNVIGYTPLHWAAINCNFLAVDLLVNHGANVNLQDMNGYTALHYASEKGCVDIVRYLIENGCNKDIKAYSIFNTSGKTALDIAKEHKYDQIVKLLSKGTEKSLY